MSRTPSSCCFHTFLWPHANTEQQFLLREFKPFERLTFWLTLLPLWCLPPSTSRTGNFLRVLHAIRTDTRTAARRDPSKDGALRTILTELPRNNKLPPAERTEDVVFINAVMLVSAGLETTGHVLETATLHLNLPENAHMLGRLKGELAAAWPDKEAAIPAWNTLEDLPYLQAVIKESLRLALGVAARLSRMNHRQAMRYRSWVIPPGTEVSMSQRDVHFDEEIFPQAGRFDPERWLGEEGRERGRWFVSFSRGTRGCVGMKYVFVPLYRRSCQSC